MGFRFAHRISGIPPSFLTELFRLSADPDLISFAGGLPSPATIDVEGISRAAEEVFSEEGREALQYTTTEGYRPLREWIARRYRRRLGIPATAEEIQIVNGSQQCLDLMGKIVLDPGDTVGMERPGYVGAIEAFRIYEPQMVGVPLETDGPDPTVLERCIGEHAFRFFYGVPNSQNPSGITYSREKRKAIAQILGSTETFFFEDDAFGELFFNRKPRIPVKRFLYDQTVMSGSFSKIVAPGMRIGWIYAPDPVIQMFNLAKQAADLHSNFLCQKILDRYLATHDLDAHLQRVTTLYGNQCQMMCDLLDDTLPASCTRTTPEGGMFLMVHLPARVDSRRVFEEGIRAKVGVLPGTPFYVNGGGEDTIRLNFSNTDPDWIGEGIPRLARVIRNLM